MNVTRQEIIAKQRIRFHNAASALRESKRFFSAYRHELAQQYQSEEAGILMQACNECITAMNELCEQMDEAASRLQWLERTL